MSEASKMPDDNLEETAPQGTPDDIASRDVRELQALLLAIANGDEASLPKVVARRSPIPQQEAVATIRSQRSAAVARTLKLLRDIFD